VIRETRKSVLVVIVGTVSILRVQNAILALKNSLKTASDVQQKVVWFAIKATTELPMESALYVKLSLKLTILAFYKTDAHNAQMVIRDHVHIVIKALRAPLTTLSSVNLLVIRANIHPWNLRRKTRPKHPIRNSMPRMSQVVQNMFIRRCIKMSLV